MKHHSIIDKNIKLLIFDCDGTLIDSMPAHYASWRAAYAELGKDFYVEEEFMLELAGMNSEQTAITTNEKYDYQVNLPDLISRKGVLFKKHSSLLQPIKKVIQIAKDYHKVLPMVVASGGDFATVSSMLKEAGIYNLFEKIITAESVTRCKPFPDIFLEAAHQVGITDYPNCLVFEDSQAGIEAAKRAGMKYVDVGTIIQPCQHLAK